MKRSLPVIFFLCVINILHAQSIDSLLEQYNRKIPQEKLHIHFDNNAYLPGQSIFYKAYLLQGNELSSVSKDLYLVWFDEQGKLIERTIAPIDGYTWSGSFTVPATYTGASLRVLAYTRWMLNFDSAFLFQRTLQVAQATERAINKTAPVPVTTLHFFPEGGDMVENISSFVAFKAINSAGMPVNVSGTIINAQKQVVCSFASEHNGMGRVAFTPLPGNSYTAEWEDPQGSKRSTQLPVAKRMGIVLSVNNETGTPSFTIERPQQSDDRFKHLQFVASMHQKMILQADVDLVDMVKLKADLNVSSYPSGVLQLTVLDKNAEPIAERILFVNNEEYQFPVSISTDTLNLKKRGKNSYTIELSDTLQASLSLSITAGEAVDDHSQDIISQLLLSSELKGHISDPSFYFSDADSSKHYLDLVMMTHGWRRFNWTDIMNRATPPLSYQHDTAYVSYSVSKGSQININSSFLPFNNTGTIASLIYLPDTTGAAYNRWMAIEQKKLEELMKKTTLKEVIVKTKAKSRVQEIEDLYATGLFKDDGIQLNITDDAVASAFPTLISYLKNRSPVAGLTIDEADPHPVTWRSGARKHDAVTALFVDEIQTEDFSSVFMADVAYIKIFRPPFAMARLGGAGGAIAVYTKKGNDAAIKTTGGSNYTPFLVYSPVKQFYSPDYAEQQLNFSQPDLRRTIFWKSDLFFDGTDKKIRVSFYNNDISHSFRIILEGIASDGRLVHVNALLK